MALSERGTGYVGSFRPPESSDPSPSTEELVSLLAAEGVEVGDGRACAALIRQIGYRRLHTYLSALRSAGDVATLARAYAAHSLDRATQALFLEYAAHFELAFRTCLSGSLARHLGSFAHLRLGAFTSPDEQRWLIACIGEQRRHRSCEADPLMGTQLANREQLPIWSVVEVLTFGALARMYRAIASSEVRAEVAASFGVGSRTLDSWLSALASMRNRCAHQGVTFGYRSPREPQTTHLLARCDARTLFGHFAILACLFAPAMAGTARAMTETLGHSLARCDGLLPRPLGFETARGAGGAPAWRCVLRGCRDAGVPAAGCGAGGQRPVGANEAGGQPSELTELLAKLAA